MKKFIRGGLTIPGTVLGGTVVIITRLSNLRGQNHELPNSLCYCDRQTQYRMGTLRDEGLGALRNRVHAYAWFSLVATEGMLEAVMNSRQR